MGRKKIIYTNEFPYHVTARTNNKEEFFPDLDICWAIFINQLAELQSDHELIVHNFVMMPNHYHLLCTTPKANLGQIMQIMQSKVSKKINHFANRINHTFGGRYGASLINSSNYFANVYKYVFRNPVNATLTSSVESYKYSSIHKLFTDTDHLLSKLKTDLPSHKFTEYLPDQSIDLLNWLNNAHTLEDQARIRKGLKKSIFKFPRDNNSHIRDIENFDSTGLKKAPSTN